ncbi:MAG TPA: LysM domain-containing protein [Candidatus Limnocylindrales bacterium]|nr:LysM domain-containing protein [Candidatus Limnocylindrales bacterium]
MTERGLPHADGAPACPFVAFDDDRDERASVPDHRHRCFAEAQPAPRALAHQEAYCLSSAFPVCPTFQDWARREAAHSRDGGRSVARATSVPMPTGHGQAPPAIVAPELARAAAAAQPPEDDRAGSPATDEEPDGGQAAWADAAAAGAAASAADARLAAAATSTPGARGGSAPDDDEDDEDDGDEDFRRSDRSDGLARRNPPRDWAAPPPWLASDEAKRRRALEAASPPSFLGHRADPGQGLAGSPADRMAGGEAIPAPAVDRSRQPDVDREEEWTSTARPGGRIRPGNRDEIEDAAQIEEEPPARRATRRPRAYEQHLGGPDGPDWERPRRYEAYPTIRTRVSLPKMGVPPIAVAAVGIVVLALALFFLPGLLKLGGGSGTGPSASPSAGAAGPSVSIAPTEPPAPTPGLYTIKKNDTLSKIAAANGITVEELLAANPAIKDPNKISLGQQIIIPLPSEEPPDTVEESTAP